LVTVVHSSQRSTHCCIDHEKQDRRGQELVYSYDWAVIFVGVSMIVYVAFGGMLATTWVQIVKAVLMLSAGAIILVMILSLVHFNPLTLFADAEQKYTAKYLLPAIT